MRSSRRHSSLLLALALIAGVLAFTAGDLADQLEELGDRAERRTDLDALVQRVPDADACGPPRTTQPMKSMLAWRLDVSMEHLADPPRAPAAIFSAPPGYAGEPAEPRPPPGFRPVAGEGEWRLFTSC